jgi:hypothetical protein
MWPELPTIMKFRPSGPLLRGRENELLSLRHHP